MKIVQSMLLALSFFGPAALISTSAQADEVDCYAPETDEIDAACSLMGVARLGLNAVNDLASDPSADLNNAKRYCQAIINGSYRLANLLHNGAADDAVQAQLNRLETTVLQLDATKRKLQVRYPGNPNVISRLTRVRGTYLVLQALLLPDQE
ncbi:MAG TPA: hypothetical protein VE954_05340 [Oligoflexus sp.]|uniref:hypothetical protein n=1 Tax=Oligoflexus sp. TaxID=1971216 RepID=UPI002D4A3E5D|nr:hypothetical protein [Oligoflexus sp.]HYX32517.1 hypothetical protein [Oligoflexus sp.]